MSKKFEPFPLQSFQSSYSSALNSNVTLSQQASRFSLPFDVKLLEVLTPKEYLEKYCRVNSRRYTLYKRFFDKYRDIQGELNMELFFDALSDTYMNTMDEKQVKQVIDLLHLPANAKITLAQFRGIAAFSERYVFNSLKRSNVVNEQLGKDVLEILDFSSLKWKLSGVNVSPALQGILKFL